MTGAREERIGPVLSARAARTRRACEVWTEANDAHGCPLDELAAEAAARTDRLHRDLTPEEISSCCVAALAKYMQGEEQRAAEAQAAAEKAARAEESERQRLDYLRRMATSRGEATPEPERHAPCLKLDALGRREASRPTPPRRVLDTTRWGRS